MEFYHELISVIVPVYNVEQFLDKCISSLQNQTYKNLEIFLIDDGSSDRSGALCDKYASEDSRIQAIHKNNGGPSSARNEGLKRCSGDYIAFVDSDDWVEPKLYETLLRLAKENHTSITGCAAITDFENGVSVNNHKDRENSIITGKTCALDVLYQTKHAWGAMYAKLFKREIIEGVLFPDISHLEDYSVSLQLSLKTDQVYFCNIPLYHYRSRQNSLSKAGYSKNKLKTIDAAEMIRNDIVSKCSDKEILDASDYFVFLMSFLILWEVYRSRPDGWKKIIYERKGKAIEAFRRYRKNSKKQPGDIKRILKFWLCVK